MPTDLAPPDWIWQHADWPALRYDATEVADRVAAARRAQGFVEGQLTSIGFEQRRQLAADAWSQEAVSTAAIEGERLDLQQVRSSVARRLGVAHDKGPNAPRDVDGLLDIMDDAVGNATAALTDDRLHGWQAALFPTGYSSLRRIRAGAYRQHAEPMQVVSGRAGHETVHYEAPPSDRVAAEMDRFLDWFNDDGAECDHLIRAALAHLWFETIHPFEDGNGRVGRVIVDRVLARDAGEASRLIRISQRLLEQRDGYYDALAAAQRGGLDVTAWVTWFVEQVRAACEQAAIVVEQALVKSRFWTAHQHQPLTARQRKVVAALLDAGPGGFEGGMSTRKYQSLAGTSRATASRELVGLVEMGLLRAHGAGRSTRYEVPLDGWAGPRRSHGTIPP